MFVCGFLYLQHGHQQHQGSYGVHQASVVGEQGIAAAPLPDVQVLGVVVIAVVGCVVGDMVLDAGSGELGLQQLKGTPSIRY